MQLIRLTPPAAPALLLSDAKEWLRVTGTEDDALIARLVDLAADQLLRQAGIATITQGWRLVVDAWPVNGVLRLPFAPLVSLDAVRIATAAGGFAAAPLDAFEIDGRAGSLRLLKPPGDPTRLRSGIEIEQTIGFGATSAALPEAVLQAIRLIVADAFENRGDAAPDLSDGVARLLAPFRRRRIA